MIRISVLYPNVPGVAFDHDYYNRNHRELVESRWRPMGLHRIEVDRGVGGMGGTAAPFVAAGHLFFESAEDFEAAFAAHGEELLADIPNFTDAEPTIQISEVAQV